MSHVTYLMNLSLDGYVEGRDGKFGWSRPDDEVHRLHSQMARNRCEPVAGVVQVSTSSCGCP